MKRIAIRSNGPWSEEQPLDDMFYLQSYVDLAEETEKLGGRIYLTKDDRYYQGGNRFARSWVIENGTAKKIDQSIECDLIFSKDSTFVPTPDAHVLNDPALDRFCNDKMKVCDVFPSLSPRTFMVSSVEECRDRLTDIPGDTVVLKPQRGYGGKGVFIGSKEEALAHADHFPLLMQEFIDSSKGIPELITTYHDLRIILMNGQIAFSFIRTPQRGSLVSNFSLGGWMMPVFREDRPAKAIDLCAVIDSELRSFKNRIYSVDCALHADGTWKLIELNAPPGQQNRMECGREADTYMRMHASLLMAA